MTVLATEYKLPTDNFDYMVQWADVIGSDTIATSTWDVPAPLTASNESFTSNTATVFIDGGVAGKSYLITSEITTALGNSYEQSFMLVINEVPATSGVSIFSVTRNDIILFALEDIKMYAPDFELPSAGAISRANVRLNMMIKAWQAAGVGLWLNTLYTQTLTAGAQSYLLGPYGTIPIPRPLSVVEARNVDINGNELVMSPMSRDEYMTLPLKSSTGKATQYYYDPQLGNGVFYVWPVNTDLTDVIKMTIRTPVQDFINLDDYPDFPVEWADALHYNLAMRLCPVFDVPPKIQAGVQQLAGITLADANDFDREQNVAVQIVPAFGPGK